MDHPSLDSSRIGELAEEFLERRARGERPQVSEYVQRHPELAREILGFFPALLAVEDLKPQTGETTGSLDEGPGSVRGLGLERLGDFRIIREVGRGGMGVVYEAEQESLGRRVALKVLGSASLLDPRRLARFHREAKAAARLHHTNIVPVFGVGEVDGVHFYVMQFIAGAGLDEVLEDVKRLQASRSGQGFRVRSADRRRDLSVIAARSLLEGGPRPANPSETGPAPSDPSNPPAAAGQSVLSAASETGPSYARSVARIGVQVAEALGHAHEQGILHRDIKPSNVLLDAHGNSWVTDFGLAKADADVDLTHTGDIVGTIRYMAPERFHGRCDARSDVYALGLTLYELLARIPPFEGSDRNALIRRVGQEEPTRLRKLDPSLPRDLETIVHKAIEKDPAHRYATAEALADDLRRFLEDRPIRARRTTLTERTWRWSRRNRLTAALAAMAAGSLVLAAIVGWVGYVSTTRALKREAIRRAVAVVATRQARAATRRAEQNVALSLEVFEELFDKLGAHDSLLVPPPPGRSQPSFGSGPRRGPGPPPPDLAGRRRPPPRSAEEPGHPDRPPPGESPGPPPPETPENSTALLQTILTFYERFARQNAANPRLQGEAAWAYRKVGALDARLGLTAEAEAAYARAGSMFEELIAADGQARQYRFLLVETCIMADPWSADPASLPALETRLRRARELIDGLVAEAPGNLDYAQAQVHVHAKLGALLQRLGRDDEAEASYRRAIAVGGSLIERLPAANRPKLDRALTCEALGTLVLERGRRDEARDLFGRAAADLQALAAEGTLFSPSADRFKSLAEALRSLGETNKAEELARRAARIGTRPPRGFFDLHGPGPSRILGRPR